MVSEFTPQRGWLRKELEKASARYQRWIAPLNTHVLKDSAFEGGLSAERHAGEQKEHEP